MRRREEGGRWRREGDGGGDGGGGRGGKEEGKENRERERQVRTGGEEIESLHAHL